MTADIENEGPAKAQGRREFIRQAAFALPVAYGAGKLVRAQEGVPSDQGTAPFSGIITRQNEPLNAEFLFPTLSSFLTPNEQFYIRSHFPVPQLAASDWKLAVEGHVERPLQFDYAELRHMPSKTFPALLECSGNSRVLLQPLQPGIRWEQGGVSNAEWTGVPLSAVLERAGVKPGAVEVILEGHDKGRLGEPRIPGDVHYARSLPIDKARRPEVLLAYKMNGEDLPVAHGYPLRAVVAGWYGMASVKWLRRIIVTDQPFRGYFQTFAYTIWERRHGGLPTLTAVTEVGVKSQIARPMKSEVVAAGAPYRVVGAAWCGESGIKSVDVSSDGGNTWSAAKLIGKPVPFAWQFFEYAWQVPNRPGKATLMARATDEHGEVQPMERDEDRRDAAITHVQRIDVFVR